jgi:hypothetical protein
MLHRRFIFGVILCAGSSSACGSSAKTSASQTSTGTPSQSCEDLTIQAIAIVEDAAASVPECIVDSDCTNLITIPADCLSSCVTVFGDDAVQNAVASKAAALADVCSRFHESGCKVSEGGCPNHPPATCTMSHCVWQ